MPITLPNSCIVRSSEEHPCYPSCKLTLDLHLAVSADGAADSGEVPSFQRGLYSAAKTSTEGIQSLPFGIFSLASFARIEKTIIQLKRGFE